MIRYLTTYGNPYTPKNKLESHVQDYLKLHNRKIVSAAKIEEFKKEILDEISSISKRYPRCKPVKTDWWESNRPEESERYLETWILSFNGASICEFKLLGGEEVTI